jgi:hypothetical protein
MGRDGVGNAWKVNRTLKVGGSTPLGSRAGGARIVTAVTATRASPPERRGLLDRPSDSFGTPDFDVDYVGFL